MSRVPRVLDPRVLARPRGVVVVGRGLHLVLAHADDDPATLVVDAVDHAGGDHPLLPEDPEAGVHHEPLGGRLGAGLVDLADAAAPAAIAASTSLRSQLFVPDCSPG